MVYKLVNTEDNISTMRKYLFVGTGEVTQQLAIYHENCGPPLTYRPTYRRKTAYLINKSILF